MGIKFILAAVLLLTPVGVAAPAPADPNVFGNLCMGRCEAPPPPESPAVLQDRIAAGIQRGEADLRGAHR